ncbi:MAG: hypothetical protein AB7J86_43035 [Vulcanimicrobiota bacterium]
MAKDLSFETAEHESEPRWPRCRGVAADTPGREAPRGTELVAAQRQREKAALDVKATPHSLRHAFARPATSKTGDIRAVQQILGSAHQKILHAHLENIGESFQHFHARPNLVCLPAGDQTT